MLVFRVLSTGLCVVCVVLLATFQPVREVRLEQVAQSATPPTACDRAPPLSVVDVAGAVTPVTLTSLLRLHDHEWISAINDRPIYDDLEAGATVAALARPGGFLDLTVTGRATERRVLVLMH